MLYREFGFFLHDYTEITRQVAQVSGPVFGWSVAMWAMRSVLQAVTLLELNAATWVHLRPHLRAEEERHRLAWIL